MQSIKLPINQPILRDYRNALTTEGQASPPFLGLLVAKLLEKKFSLNPHKKLSVLDIGCGLGNQMRLIAEQLPNFFNVIVGLDWSQATVEKHSKDNNSIYSKVFLCDSSKLPFKRNEFDIALSMENLEHLYFDLSIAAIEEMIRISHFCVITTPFPRDCINFGWIYPEIVDAINDPFYLDQRDFRCLESAVHKSTVFVSSMIKAGFHLESSSHGVYFGESSKIKPNLIHTVGIQPVFVANSKEETQTGFSDFKWPYVSLLAKSANLQKDILNHPIYEEDQLLFKQENQTSIRQIFNWLPNPIKKLARASRQFWLTLFLDYQK